MNATGGQFFALPVAIRHRSPLRRQGAVTAGQFAASHTATNHLLEDSQLVHQRLLKPGHLLPPGGLARSLVGFRISLGIQPQVGGDQVKSLALGSGDAGVDEKIEAVASGWIASSTADPPAISSFFGQASETILTAAAEAWAMPSQRREITDTQGSPNVGPEATGRGFHSGEVNHAARSPPGLRLPYTRRIAGSRGHPSLLL